MIRRYPSSHCAGFEHAVRHSRRQVTAEAACSAHCSVDFFSPLKEMEDWSEERRRFIYLRAVTVSRFVKNSKARRNFELNKTDSVSLNTGDKTPRQNRTKMYALTPVLSGTIHASGFPCISGLSKPSTPASWPAFVFRRTAVLASAVRLAVLREWRGLFSLSLHVP